jgi:hypothetical protein
MKQASKKRPRTSAPRDPNVAGSKKTRSRISNGAELLPDIDGRSAIARRYRDIAHAIMTDQGGPDHCSESRLQLIRRFEAAAVIAEQLEAKLARGEEIDITEHALLVSTLVRVAQRIGINRIPRNITPSLGEYLDAQEAAQDAQDQAEADA